MAASPVSSICPQPLFVLSRSASFEFRLPIAVSLKILGEFGFIPEFARCSILSRNWRLIANHDQVWSSVHKLLKLEEHNNFKSSVSKQVILSKQRIKDSTALLDFPEIQMWQIQDEVRKAGDSGKTLAYCKKLEKDLTDKFNLKSHRRACIEHGFQAHLLLSRIGFSRMEEAVVCMRRLAITYDRKELYILLGKGYLDVNQPQKAVELIETLSQEGDLGLFNPEMLGYQIVSYYLRRNMFIEAFNATIKVPIKMIEDLIPAGVKEIIGLWFGKCNEFPEHVSLLFQVIQRFTKPGSFQKLWYIRELISDHEKLNISVDNILIFFHDDLLNTKVSTVIDIYIKAGKLDFAIEKMRTFPFQPKTSSQLRLLEDLKYALEKAGQLEKAALIDKQIIACQSAQ